MSTKIGYYKFKRMPKTEQKAFKAAGGKVKLPILTYFVGAFLVVAAAHSCDSTDNKVEQYPWTKAETACWNSVRSATNAGLTEVSIGSNKDWGKDGYAVRVNIEKDAADLSVTCYAKADGTVVKLSQPKIIIN